MKPTVLEQAIFRTTAWFSVFGYPVTVFEIWKWLYAPEEQYSLAAVMEVLQKSEWLSLSLQKQHGFFATRSAGSMQELCRTRQERFLDAVRKFSHVRRAAKWFSLLPSVQGVAVGNTLSWWHTRPQSDIDLFIITRPGTIWATRALLVIPFAILGKRPSAQGTEERVDTFCFSFFTTERTLQMQTLSLEGGDPYLAFWTKALVPLLDRGGVFEVFEKENTWVNEILPNANMRHTHRELRARIFPALPVPLRAAEASFRQLQQRKFPPRIRDGANQDSRIVVTNDMLKFHANDRRKQFRSAWKQVISETYDA